MQNRIIKQKHKCFEQKCETQYLVFSALIFCVGLIDKKRPHVSFSYLQNPVVTYLPSPLCIHVSVYMCMCICNSFERDLDKLQWADIHTEFLIKPFEYYTVNAELREKVHGWVIEKVKYNAKVFSTVLDFFFYHIAILKGIKNICSNKNILFNGFRV